MSDIKTAKDTLVASLFSLSKAANDAANAAVEFYKVATNGSDDVSAEQLKSISDALKTATDLTSGTLKTEGTEHKRKRKQEKDPNAPKKPLTMFFQFSYDLRKQIGVERKKKDLPSLSAIDMNSMIKERWDNITPEEKAAYKKRYDDAMIVYNGEKKKYETSLVDGTSYHPPKSVQSPIVEEVVAEPLIEDIQVDHPSSVEEPKKKKKKSEKKEKKKKHSSHGSS
ncbi:Transcriptional regulator HMO1 [Candida viswanathii]|uniref:Transcriptional regulator HMO1 n=1 Tax=Candida viswanathii TaxID=5486 RepID=A0A367XZB3_9ASCO|nr:Transcriptional regulator HMO1 [Candida viswanathii]